MSGFASLYPTYLLNSFVNIFGTPTDMVRNENHLEACWGVCMKDRIGSFFSNRRRSRESDVFKYTPKVLETEHSLPMSFKCHIYRENSIDSDFLFLRYRVTFLA